MRYLSVYYKVFFLRTMHKNWYIIKTISGHENKVKYYIETEIIERVYFPGYLIIEAFLSGEILHYINNIPEVIHFLTEKKGGKPIPMKKQDITDLLVKISILAEAEVYGTIDINLMKNGKKN